MLYVVERLKTFYADFTGADLNRLADFYHADVQFIDPVDSICGLAMLRAYFERTRPGLNHCRFVFEEQFDCDGDVCLVWTMHYSHSKLRSGKNLQLPGISRLWVRDDLVIYHRDYYDLGQMLYEHIPLMGRAVRALKQRI